MKKSIRKLGIRVEGLAISKPTSVDLGALQHELIAARKDLKSKTTVMERAVNAYDEAKLRVKSATEKMTAATRAVMVEG